MSSGTYVVFLRCGKKLNIQIGCLGLLTTKPGFYAYVGSAFGPGGVQARVRHHFALSERPRWHLFIANPWLAGIAMTRNAGNASGPGFFPGYRIKSGR